jgi:hypothetical protein
MIIFNVFVLYLCYVYKVTENIPLKSRERKAWIKNTYI